jgi:hypothetical protein
VFDVRRRAGSGATRVLLRGPGGAKIVVDPADPTTGAGLEDVWNRFEGALRGERLSLSLNGRALFEERRFDGIPDPGPPRIEPAGPIEFANLFVRSLE